MRSLKAATLGIALAAACLLQGCAWVHFGRIPPTDDKLLRENAELRLESKILREELKLARREGETLRLALEARPGGGDEQLAEKLAQATRELAQLRASPVRLEKEDSMAVARISTPGEMGTLKTEIETLRDQVQEERRRNLSLEGKVRELGAEGERSAQALTLLNEELSAQKEARRAAESAITSLRAQLQAVMAREQAVSAAANTLAPAGGAAPTAVLTFSAARMGAQEARAPSLRVATQSSPKQAAPAAPQPSQLHLVKDGDTLESLARQYYGKPERWPLIYSANNALLRDGRALEPGMELVIPPLPEAEAGGR